MIQMSAAFQRKFVLPFIATALASVAFTSDGYAQTEVGGRHGNAPKPKTEVNMSYDYMHESDAYESLEKDLEKALQEGMDAMQAGDYETADAMFEIILERNPNQPQVNYYMAVVKIGEGDMPSSVPYLDTAIAADPDYVEPRYLLAKIALMTGDTDVAQAQLGALKEIQAACQSGGCEANTNLLPAAVSELEGALS